MTIAPDIHPAARDALKYLPSWLRLVFAGPDEAFVVALRREFRLPITDPEVLVVADAPRMLVVVDDLVLVVEARPGVYDITPVRTGDRPFAETWNVGAVIEAFDSLLIRRVMPTGRTQ